MFIGVLHIYIYIYCTLIIAYINSRYMISIAGCFGYFLKRVTRDCTFFFFFFSVRGFLVIVSLVSLFSSFCLLINIYIYNYFCVLLPVLDQLLLFTVFV